MTDEQLAFSPVRELGKLLRSGTVSSVELTTLYLRRLDRLGPKLNAIVTLMHDRALAQAKRADKELQAGDDRGPLHGIPYGVKDLLATVGAPTTWGATPFRHQVFGFDATVVKRLTKAGGVLVAKLAMIELAGGMGYNQADASFTGPCKSPWNLGFWSGGSSSGSGAAVSSGLVPFAIGSETSGSIMTPAAYCGITGLRPTYGRVSRHGAMALCWTLDKLGAICRTADDAGLVLGAIAGADPEDPTSVPRDFAYPGQPKSQWRIATIKGALAKVQPEVKKNFEASLAALHSVASLREIELPKFPYGEMIESIIAAEGGAAFRDIIEDGRVQQLKDENGRRGGYAYLVANAVDYVDAMRLRRPLRRAFDEIFDKTDLIVAPTRASVALPIGVPFDKAYPGVRGGPLIPACNLAGIPAISVPNGFGRNGLPTGISFVGRAFSEAELIAAAAAFQTRTDWHARRPAFAAG